VNSQTNASGSSGFNFFHHRQPAPASGASSGFKFSQHKFQRDDDDIRFVGTVKKLDNSKQPPRNMPELLPISQNAKHSTSNGLSNGVESSGRRSIFDFINKNRVSVVNFRLGRA
jgi:hypothetical protein